MLQIGLLTMYNEDPTILDSTYFPLPEGIDHTTLDPLLLAETAELELLYPEPNTLKTVIYAWSMARNPAWAKILAALEAEYSPIENYDRSETWTDTRNLTDNHTGSEKIPFMDNRGEIKHFHAQNILENGELTEI